MYKQIAQQIEANGNAMKKAYEAQRKELDMKGTANDKKCKMHNRVLKESLNEKKNNGGCAEYSNMIVSIFNSEHMNNENKNSWEVILIAVIYVYE